MNQTGISVNGEGIISDYAVSEPSTIVFGGKIPVDVNTAYDASGFGLLPYLSPSYDNISIGTSNAVGNIYVNPNEKNLTNYQSYARYNNTWEVSYDNPTITAQLNGGDTYVSSFAQSATLYPVFYLEGNGNSGYFIRFVAITQYIPSMPTFTIGTGYYFLNITSIYTNTNTSISNNYFWNGHITDIECYVLPELNNQPIIPLNYSGYITNSGLIYLNSSQFVNYHYNITFKYYSTVSPINYTFNEFYMPIFELGMIFLIGSVVYIEIRGYYRSIKER